MSDLVRFGGQPASIPEVVVESLRTRQDPRTGACARRSLLKQCENTAMRLTIDQVKAIRQTAQRVLGAGARVSVYGSRALDNRKGGDIDLFFETDALLDNRADVLCQLYGALTLALGERKIDVLLKDANTPPAPVFEIAKRTGFPLENAFGLK